jgi:hypothetical protein
MQMDLREQNRKNNSITAIENAWNNRGAVLQDTMKKICAWTLPFKPSLTLLAHLAHSTSTGSAPTI